MSLPESTGHDSNVSKDNDSGITSRERQTKMPRNYYGDHRFEAPEEGPAIDCESEQKTAREIKRSYEALKRQSEAINRLQGMRIQYKRANQDETTPEGALLLIGVGCIVIPSIYMLSNGLGIVPIVIIVIGVTLLIGVGLVLRNEFRKGK